MSHISDMLGGWQGNPEELRNQEALFNMYSSQSHPNSPNNYLYRSDEPQALVPMQGFESQGLQNIGSMAGSDSYGRVPIWQTRSGFRQSLFQRLGYSMMFSSYTRSSHNIFTPTGSQRRRPVFLIIGGTCRSSMYSGIPTESVYSDNTGSGPVITELPDTPDEEDQKCLEFPPFQGKSGMSIDNTSGGPVITELPNTPDEEDQKCLEFKPLPGQSRLSLNKHKNKLPVLSKSESEHKEHDSLSDVMVNLNETVSQQFTNHISMENTDSNTNKSKFEDFSEGTNIESNSYSSLPSMSGHDNNENTAHTETEENQNIELAEVIAADTREPDMETMITDKSIFNNEDEMVQLISDVKQSTNRNQSVNKVYMPSNNKNRELSSNTTQGKYKSRMSTDNISGRPVIAKLPNTPDGEDQKCLEFKLLPGKPRLSLNKHKNKLPSETELKEHDSLSDVKVNLIETVSQQFSNNTSMEYTDSNTNKSKREDFSEGTNIESNSYSSLPSMSGHDNTENTAHNKTKENQNIELAEVIAADTREPDMEIMDTDKSAFNNEDEMVQLVSDLKQSTNRNQSVKKECMSSNNKNREPNSNTAQGKYNNPVKDRKERCKGKSNKGRDENKTRHVQSRVNRLSVQFNLGHLDKTERVNSEAILTDKTKADEEPKCFVTRAGTTGKKPAPAACSSKENKTDLAASTLSSLPEKNEELLSIDDYKNCLTEPSGFETPTNTANAKDSYSADSYSERLVERTNGNSAVEQDLVPISCSKAESPFEGELRANPTVTPADADSTAIFENSADQDFIAGTTALKAGSESDNQFDGVDGVYASSTKEFHDNFDWRSDEPVVEPKTHTQCTDNWHQDQYGAEEERGLRYLEMVSNLRGLVAKEGLKVKDVYPDGNCLFAAVVDQLRVRGEFYFTPRTLRNAAVEHLKQNPFQPDGTPLFCFVTDASWEAYLMRMAKEGEWGDHLIISAISSVLKRKLVILGGLSGLSRTVQEPDHAYKEITRGMKHPDTSTSKDLGNGVSDRRKDGNNGVKGKPEQQRETVNPKVPHHKEEAEALYLGHLAESHYVSLRRQDWEQELHAILISKKDSSLLTYRSDKKLSDEDNGDDTAGSGKDCLTFTRSPHSNFLLKVIVSRCLASVEPTDESYSGKTGSTETVFTGPMIDHLYAVMPNINFESVWHRRGLPPEEKKEAVSNELGCDYVCLFTATDTFVADTRKGLTNKDLLIDNSSCRPGYTRLTPMKQSVWMKNAGEGLDGKVYLKHLHVKRPKNAEDNFDKMTSLLAFRCHWPEVAFEWLDRNRPHDWPPRSFIWKIEETGCRVVPRSHSFTKEKDIEWMFSFALAEKMLARDATSKIQRSCFQFLTLLLGNSLGNQSKITYFHFKSVFFYACERLDQPTWDQQPAFCVSEMIRYLMDGFEARFLPCYFVKNNNIIEDFTDSELMFHTQRLETLHRHFIVNVYFMLDAKGLTVADQHPIFDNVVSDFQQYQEHRHLGTSIAECFLPCIEKHICLFTSSKFYNKMVDLASEAAAELNTTFAYEITVKDLLLQAIQTLPLDKGWLCAFYVDQKLPLSLTDRVSEGLNTVSLLDFLGEEILSSVTSVGNDIRVPEELVTVDNIVPFISDFTKLLKDDLNVGSDMYTTAWLFFFDMHLNSVEQFIRSSCTTANPEEKRLFAMKQRASTLCLQTALITIRLEINNLNGEQSVTKLREVEYYLRVLEGK